MRGVGEAGRWLLAGPPSNVSADERLEQSRATRRLDPEGDAIAVWEHLTQRRRSGGRAGSGNAGRRQLADTRRPARKRVNRRGPRALPSIRKATRSSPGSTKSAAKASSRQPRSRPVAAWQTPGLLLGRWRVGVRSQGRPRCARAMPLSLWTRDNGSSFVIQAASMHTGGGWETPVNLSESGRNAFAPAAGRRCSRRRGRSLEQRGIGGEVTRAAVRSAGRRELADRRWRYLGNQLASRWGNATRRQPIDSQGDAVVDLAAREGRQRNDPGRELRGRRARSCRKSRSPRTPRSVSRCPSRSRRSTRGRRSGRPRWNFGDGGSAAGTSATPCLRGPRQL